jgi:lysophospholipase L1-like esterase
VKGSGLIPAIALFAIAQGPPSTALLSNVDVNNLCVRTAQLMEAGGVAIPELQRAAAPVIENARQACVQLQIRGGSGQATYTLLSNVRAYIALADSVPRPFPFPETAREQLAELREDSARLDVHFRALLDSKDLQLRSPDPDNLTRYSESNRRLAPPETAKTRVVFFGDSITDLWRLNEYFPERDFINRGIGGQTTSQLLGRMKADVLDLKPQAVVILAGTNDLARAVPLTAIEDNYVVLAELAAARGIKVVFASVLPVSDYHKDVNRTFEQTLVRAPAYIVALNDWLKAYCAQRGHVYLNYFDALADPQGRIGEDLADDGLHPNAKGYRIMAPLVLEAIAKTLPKSAPAPVEAEKPRKRK